MLLINIILTALGFSPAEQQMIIEVLHMAGPIIILVIIFIVIVLRSQNSHENYN